MTRNLTAVPLTAEGFSQFGDVIEVTGSPDKLINQGKCGRHHDLANLDFGTGRAGISVFDAQARHLPHVVEVMERHPQGSQAFIPINSVPMLIVVAADDAGMPTDPVAFVSAPGQSINLHRNVWHGVLTPLNAPGCYVVVDHIGDGPNLEEHWFDAPYIVDSQQS